MRIPTVIVILLIIGLTTGLKAQQASTQSKSISKGLGLYVFPSKDQNQDQQSKDETECYKWAIQQTGYDPLNPPEIKPQEAKKTYGGAVIGGAKGAAAGAAIGAIAGDAGEGAAIGAVVGGLRGRRARIVGNEMKQAQSEEASKDKALQMLADYKKAFSACMEGKGYTVK